ncbi:MAG TPA: MG2 domain-containing protein [Telluria sp.]|nr:MG2 domain-containing protein [Telluria sp.]
MRASSLLLGLAGLAFIPFAAAQATVEAFSPDGTVKKVRQVTARFSADIVPLGTLAQPDPFTVECGASGKGRWIDTRNWSYDFDQDLSAGVRCTFTVRPGLRDLAGQPVPVSTHRFDTGGPAVVETIPWEGARIAEDQVFVLGLDGVARMDSVAQHAWCKAEGLNERIGVRVLDGAERDKVLASRKQFIDRFLEAYFKIGDRVVRTIIPGTAQKHEGMPFVVLQCRRTLPAGVPVKLVWDAGIMSASGVATTEAQELAYRTRPDFSARLSCGRMVPKGGCIPFQPVTLEFSAPVDRKALAGVALTDKAGKRYPVAVDERDRSTTTEALSFPGPFPADAELTLALPPGLVDDAGRKLVNAASFPLKQKTSAYPPLAKFPARFGILEAHGGRLLPVTVRNVENELALGVLPGSVEGKVLRVEDGEVIAWLRKMSSYGWNPGSQDLDDMKASLLGGASGAGRITLPRMQGSESEVIGIPLPRPGFYVVELASPMLGEALAGKKTTAYVNAAALVTNMAAHFKRGAESSVVWVTSLDKGRPIAGASVAVRGCDGRQIWAGNTDADGVARIRTQLVPTGCKYGQNFFVSARLGEDMTFTLSDWDRGIEPYRFGVNSGSSVGSDNTLAATVFDRTLLRAGETVHMKHFLRKHTMRGLETLAATDKRHGSDRVRPADSEAEGEMSIEDTSSRPARAYIVHEGTDEKFAVPLAWNKNATAAAQWKIPAGAKLGTYSVYVGGIMSGSFRVEQFRIPVMKAVLQGPREPQVAPSAVSLDMQVSYLSGGGASFAPVTLRTTVSPRYVAFPGYAAFSFGAEPVRLGVESTSRGASDDEEEYGPEEASQSSQSAVRTRQLSLDKAGGARVKADGLPATVTPAELLAEVSYQDPNGEIQTVSERVALWPAAISLGLRREGWIAGKGGLKFQAVVLDLAGKPVAGAPVAIEFYQRITYSHRKRLLGGLYSYESSTEIKKAGPACDGVTDAQGLLSCTVNSPVEGDVILQASAADASGRRVFARQEIWVNKAEQWFDVSDSDRIDLLPQQKRYEPGQDATFQVRSPFREATALITVEREGVIDTYVRRLSGKDPSFSIPVKANYTPNVFVSALVVRGRVEGVKPTALLDLGKPAYKLGIAPIQVGWAAHELKVQVAADKTVYKVREKAQVKVKVARANGARLPAGTEIALAAVDVGLLELMPNDSWNLLEKMMNERGLQVVTSTAQMQVVGKRHFGRKALPAGGDGGGRSSGRELFDTLLFWKARVTLDANGEATVQVPINDSLSSFRFVAIASGGANLFGTGSTDVRTSQDLMLLSGLPQMVREGDRVRAGFTVRNASGKELNASLKLSVAADGGAATALEERQLTLAAGEAREIGWDYTVPFGAKALAWEAQASSAQARDLVRVRQEVKAAVPVRTLQATLVRVDKPLSIPVQVPAGAVPGRGGIVASFTPTIAGGMPGVREFMRAYPYTCFEQRASQAVALRDEAAWDEVMTTLSGHLDKDGLVKYFTMMDQGSDTLTAYVLSVAHEAGYGIEDELRQKMEEGLTGFVRGTVVRYSALPTADLAVRKVGALEALSRSRPVEADMLGSFDVAPNLWPTAAVIDWYLVLRRSPDLPERDVRMAQAAQVLRARLNMQGTTMGFSTERTDSWWWLMMSGDSNANRLLLAVMDEPSWKQDMGRLARGALGRQLKGHWDTTVANAWGVLAMEKFSEAFESEPVTGGSAASLASVNRTVTWPADASEAKDKAVSFPWPAGLQRLGLAHKGGGAPWAVVQSMAAVPISAPQGSGFKAVRTVTPMERKTAGAWSRGDVYRVRLDLEAQSDMTWVVVDDPIPAGASILGTGLGRDSQIQSSGERERGWVWPAFKERANDGFRAYYAFVPKGKWSVEYTVRLNNAGQFTLPPTHVEAMYNPEMFGDTPNAPMTVVQ